MNELRAPSVAMFWGCPWSLAAIGVLAMGLCSAISTMSLPIPHCPQRSGITRSYTASCISVIKVQMTFCLSRRSISSACSSMILSSVSLIMVPVTLIAFPLVPRRRRLVLVSSFLCRHPSCPCLFAFNFVRTFSDFMPPTGSPCMPATVPKMNRRGSLSAGMRESL